MAILSGILLALTLGVTIGLNVKRLVIHPKQKQKTPESINQTSAHNKHDKQKLIPYLDTLEIRFVKRILNQEDKLLSVNEANEILRIERLSKENQRQRRHIFLKELNLKLKMIYQIPECIERKSTDLDRRSKFYCLHEQISKESIKEMLLDENNNQS